MTGTALEVPDIEQGLPIDEIEARLCAAAKRHHLEERNIAYWLCEIDGRGLHRERGFSSIGDYAMELVGIKPRKAQYLVFIASRLEKLPMIREAFDSGELSWTKAREITSVATPETEADWLAKARALKNRDLEKEVRRHTGQTSGGFATVTISMPVEVLEMWNDAYELAERISGSELEKWQVLEPALAEFLGTQLPIAAEGGGYEGDGHGEDGLPPELRNAVFDRDGWQCVFPGCTMRKMLDPHHIVFRSHGGTDDLENVICLCRMHHGLVHRGICHITGRVGVDLTFERPRLVTEKTAPVGAEPVEVDHPVEVDKPSDDASPPASDEEDDDSWRDEVVADIFDGPPMPAKKPRFEDYNDALNHWIEQRRLLELDERSRNRRASSKARAHVCAEAEEVRPHAPGTTERPRGG
jgi:hypothetical protein